MGRGVTNRATHVCTRSFIRSVKVWSKVSIYSRSDTLLDIKIFIHVHGLCPYIPANLQYKTLICVKNVSFQSQIEQNSIMD